MSARALLERLEEEINRAARHGTALSCLVVAIDDLADLALVHGEELAERALDYVAVALRRELRRFDRVGETTERELAVVLPGADERRAELVARRALGRLRAIKIEVEDVRRPLRMSVGIAAWRSPLSAEDLLGLARTAAVGTLDDSTLARLADRGTAPPPGGVLRPRSA